MREQLIIEADTATPWELGESLNSLENKIRISINWLILQNKDKFPVRDFSNVLVLVRRYVSSKPIDAMLIEINGAECIGKVKDTEEEIHFNLDHIESISDKIYILELLTFKFKKTEL